MESRNLTASFQGSNKSSNPIIPQTSHSNPNLSSWIRESESVNTSQSLVNNQCLIFLIPKFSTLTSHPVNGAKRPVVGSHAFAPWPVFSQMWQLYFKVETPSRQNPTNNSLIPTKTTVIGISALLSNPNVLNWIGLRHFKEYLVYLGCFHHPIFAESYKRSGIPTEKLMKTPW